MRSRLTSTRHPFNHPHPPPREDTAAYNGNGELIGRNDNWQETQLGGVITEDQVAEIQASGLAPERAAESVIIAVLPPGAYTSVLRGADGGTGIAPQKCSTSSRSRNPTSRIASRNSRVGSCSTSGSLIQSNDNWRGDQEQELIATTLAPMENAEAAIVVTLAPGGYTAVVRGAAETTGVALVEVYNLGEDGGSKRSPRPRAPPSNYFFFLSGAPCCTTRVCCACCWRCAMTK
ncbi:hypothetical protein BH20VER2_BH20VER2_02780 [soil metagenome]